ncbi:MAG: BMC domain-containing protein [Liquorilactobacillus nagelii]|jgi:microcompartment protein CcmL/EutN|uniref:BMC domain-containing protein n=1 Tax=Liquorilactobacillus nagelii TaxID=82688 RepID=A0A3Q8CDC6_9LACO|nr:BMC domain-containing protein [Liquorilactobacillus nagelii]AUJ32728.1 hypothetical protein BSQ50_09395 [Liquorilactobacillus nagelii]MCC7616947.1 hypothetical protein [Liquorilactobacillus nagelii]MCP9315630.1 BMC domain-containing protein [Liquorilactobacillus nagelii]
MNDALGMLEVRGYVAAIEYADVMVKAANVKIIKVQKTRGMGWMTVLVTGNVAAVQASVHTAQMSAIENHQFISSKVIPRPHGDIDIFLEKPVLEKKNKKVSEKQQLKAETSKIDNNLPNKKNIAPVKETGITDKTSSNESRTKVTKPESSVTKATPKTTSKTAPKVISRVNKGTNQLKKK